MLNASPVQAFVLELLQPVVDDLPLNSSNLTHLDTCVASPHAVLHAKTFLVSDRKPWTKVRGFD